MSVWKRDLFKWSRSDRPTNPAVLLGQVDGDNPSVKSLHSAASSGRKKDVIRCLQTGINPDVPNDAGQTPLFIAAYQGHYRVVEILLHNGANPNEKSKTGMTPVHVACYTGSLRVLGAMIEAGGDLRLHDNQGGTCMDWAKRQADPKRRLKMLEFLQKSQLFALSYSGDFASVRASRSVERPSSFLQLLRSKVGSHISLESYPDWVPHRVRSHGFGRVYYGGDASSGVLSVVPLITENMLSEDDQGVCFNVSSHFVMTSMKWNMTLVTVKRLDKFAVGENYVDLLISEVEHLSKLRHPNILLLMCLCQTPSLDVIMLVFERVGLGSLHYVLYEQMDRLPMTYVRDIARQVCEALLFMHNQNCLHCGLSSHAIFLVSKHQAKVGCLEHMVERKKAEAGHGNAVITEKQKDQINRWMAPELMMGQPLSPASDVYSYCTVLWEMIIGEIPWKSLTAQEVFDKVTLEQEQLPVLEARTPQLFRGILEHGLRLDPAERPADFCTLLSWLQGPIDKAPGWKSSSLDRLLTLRRESDQRICIGGSSADRADLADGKDSDGASISREQRRSSFGSDGRQGGYSVSQQTSRTSCNWNDVDGRPRPGGGVTSDANNHFRTAFMKEVSEEVTDSCSPLDDSESDECDGKKTFERTKHAPKRSRGKTDSLTKPPVAQQNSRVKFSPNDRDISPSSGHASRLKRRSCPPQTKFPLSPNVYSYSSRSVRDSRASQFAYVNMAAQEGDCKFLPPVKPASHSTDVKAFISGDPYCSTRTLPAAYSPKTSSLPRNSLFYAWSPRSPRSRSALSRQSPARESLTDENIKDAKLRHQGSVRSLAELFQAHCYNHTLRQSILRGSAFPQGTCSDDLSLLLRDRLKLNEDICSKQDQSQTSPSDSQQELEKGEATPSSESLTTVSNQGSPQEVETPRRKSRPDLMPNVSATMPTASAAETFLPIAPDRDLSHVPLRSEPKVETCSNPRALPQNVSSRVTDTAGRPRTWGTIVPDSMRPRFSRSDISNEYFDFHEYYIDDDISCPWDSEAGGKLGSTSRGDVGSTKQPSGYITGNVDDRRGSRENCTDDALTSTAAHLPSTDRMSGCVHRARRCKSETTLTQGQREAYFLEEDQDPDCPAQSKDGCIVLNFERSFLTDEGKEGGVAEGIA